MAFRLFQYPIPAPEDLPELNAFLSSRRVVAVKQNVVQRSDSAWLVFSVEFVDGKAAEPGEPAKGGRPPKVDYREVLSEEQFARFSRLRDWRKATAETEGVPIYAVFTNAQLGEMVQREVRSDSDLLAIPGLGAARVERHGRAVLEILSNC